jgi:hypothetical protein
MSLAFDTLKFVEKLEDGGFSHAQAKAAAEAFADATGEQLVTKGDLAALNADLHAAIASSKADLRAEIGTVKTDLRVEIWTLKADLHAQIASVKADVLLLKWLMGFILAFQVGIFVKLFTH